MARKRDHKAEYARAKERAKAAGYGSQRGYKKARKAAGIPRTASPLHARTQKRMYPNGIPSVIDYGMLKKRVEAQNWSDAHSRTVRSEFDNSWGDEKVQLFWQAYCKEPDASSAKKRSIQKRMWIKDWLVPQWMTETEWTQSY